MVGSASKERSVTELLRDWRSGDDRSLAELMPRVYAELHRLAGAFMNRERPGHTLRPTDLVNEAYLKLSAADVAYANRAHFFAVAARTMRQILVDHARKRNAGKRGHGERPVALDDNVLAGERPDELVALDEALEELGRFDPRKARIVELHYFGGMTHGEIAEALDLHANTVARDLRMAEAWIHRQLRSK